MRATFDASGDPTDETLTIIEGWPMNDYEGLARFVCDTWNNDYGLFTYSEERFKLVTGGWSGNESVIAAMMGNSLWWYMYWSMSKRGGLYEFEPQVVGGKMEDGLGG